ncbi:hypothetical protein C2I17_17460 [Niallia circulans]|uniref:caspase family protein n=1 Tax=Niallia circulans TaxID=1397 RepID=UPI00201D99E2|nr:caspase family protein [Niallia circulans]UQZ76201.1 hypothetical protein C2I17_17460 [Niallia circulans]
MSVRYGVIVGINDYTGTGINNLSLASKDAIAFYEAITHYSQFEKENVYLFTDTEYEEARNPTYSDILSSIQSISEKATSEDLIMFYFAGHGTADQQDSYLLTKEYRENVLRDSSIPMDKVNSIFEESKAKFKLRFFDACNSGRMGRRGDNAEFKDKLTVSAEGWATLAACKEEQYAHELGELGHGIFSYFLVKGLSGEASIDKKTVSLDNLKVYVMDNTIKLTNKYGLPQIPVFTGVQAGSLILSNIIDQKENKVLPSSVEHILTTSEQDYAPSTPLEEDFLDELDEILNMENSSVKFVVNTYDEKISKSNIVLEDVIKWAEYKIVDLQKKGSSEAKLSSLSNSILNKSIANFLYERSGISEVLEVRFTFDKITKYRKGKETIIEEANDRFSFGLHGNNVKKTRYEDVNIPYEVEEIKGIKNLIEIDNVVELVFNPESKTIPNCAMVVSVIPASFGMYLFVYFGSTKINVKTEEIWNEDTFSVKELFPIAVNDNYSDDMFERLDSVYVEFISYIVENIKARRMLFERLGAIDK